MGLHYENLDQKTRDFMIEELEMDISNGKLYLSPRLNSGGQKNWSSLLKESFESHDDSWLSIELRNRLCMNNQEVRRTRSGGTTVCNVPITATKTLAEGEFNRFYCRGLCARAIAEETKEVEIYRGKQVQEPRAISVAKIGLRCNL